MRKYSGMNPEDPVAQGLLKVNSVTKAQPDVQKRLQKTEGWSKRSLEEILREAQSVYVRRGDEKEKQKAKLMVSMAEQVVKQRMGNREKKIGGRLCPGGRQGEGRSQGYPVRPQLQPSVGKCFWCGQPGHIKKNCPERKREEKLPAALNSE